MSKSQPAAHIVSLVRQLFGEKPFATWNCGSYHDANHAMYVAEVVTSMAGKRHRDPNSRLFLAQVALLHDADPRPADRPTPASVLRTLEWMWSRKEWLQETLWWTDAAFDTAMALIARTDFPFNDVPRQADTMFDGLSPYQVYSNLLLQLKPEARVRAFEDAQMLRFADQCANYCRDFPTASLSVDHLSQEMHNVGAKVSRWDLDTPTFIEGLASDCHWDARIKKELRLSGRVFSQTELVHSLEPKMRDLLQRNKELFSRERQAKHATG